MERPERPRRHKSVMLRQASRTHRPRSSSPRNPYEVGYESDSDTDMEVDAHQPQLPYSRFVEERPRPPRLTPPLHQHPVNNVTEVGPTLTSRISNKRPRHCVVEVPYNARTGQSSFTNTVSSFVPRTLIPAPMLPLAGTSQGESVQMSDVNIPITTDNNSTINNRRIDPGPSDTSFTRSLQPSTSGSNTNVSSSRILQEIDELCFSFPPRPRLSVRRRLNPLRQSSGVQNEVLDCSGCIINNPIPPPSNNNTFLASESPLSPPPVDAGVSVDDDEGDYITMSIPYHRSVHAPTNCDRDNRTQEPEEEPPTVMCEILMNSADPHQRPDGNQVQHNFHFTPFFGTARFNSVIQSSPPISPVLRRFDSPQSAFSPTTPLTTPPSSPTNDIAQAINENQSEGIRVQFVTEFFGETSEEDNISNEESNPINEVIVLDTPEIPNTSENTNPVSTENTTLSFPTTNEVVVNQEQSEPAVQLDSTATVSPSHTPPLSSMPTSNSSENLNKEVINASETLKKLNQNLVSLLECPVCLDFMVPPILQCNKGHLVCAACRPKLALCPTCRSRFAERNLAMEKVAEKLMYPCKNVVTGCKVTMKLKDKFKHEQNCGFRHFDCIVRSCEWKGYKPELIVHLSLVHHEKLVIGNEKQLIVSYLSGRSSWIFYTFEEVFLMTIVADSVNKKFTCCMQLIGAPEKASQFLYSVKLARPEPYMSAEFCHQIHSDESSSLSLFYTNQGLIMDASYVKQFATNANHRRVLLDILIKRRPNLVSI